MPNYTFTLEFKDKIQLFFNPSLLSDIEKACTNYNQFVFGQNIKNMKKYDIDENKVNITLQLNHKITNEDFDDAVNNVIKQMKKQGYVFKRGKSSTKTNKTNKTNKKKKRTQKNKTNKSK